MKKKGTGEKPNLKRKKNTSGLVRIRPGHGLTYWVLQGCCTGRSFNKPRPVQPPGPGSTCRAGPGLIIVVYGVGLFLERKKKGRGWRLVLEKIILYGSPPPLYF
jgi:hypothetical protein